MIPFQLFPAFFNLNYRLWKSRHLCNLILFFVIGEYLRYYGVTSITWWAMSPTIAFKMRFSGHRNIGINLLNICGLLIYSFCCFFSKIFHDSTMTFLKKREILSLPFLNTLNPPQSFWLGLTCCVLLDRAPAFMELMFYLGMGKLKLKLP